MTYIIIGNGNSLGKFDGIRWLHLSRALGKTLPLFPQPVAMYCKSQWHCGGLCSLPTFFYGELKAIAVTSVLSCCGLIHTGTGAVGPRTSRAVATEYSLNIR